ncbi:DUF86 domain-containing protein [Phragmitibacter flavus]|uniref:DUF86 domain-containing protein n=1 Tax=Phragmitibacter flavus TaxID=2576071 RepID=A0A5R8KJA3_9BACT|nr:HepT-like ribonuclease domain-containing protein [Phragmitibacter flavus]TLD72406.1 DUF86 domain-containing protein [Phragmitibacter flavus]
MKPARGDSSRLQDILEAIEAIERHPVKDRPAFDSDELLRFFVLKHIEILGEAIFKLSTELKDRHPQVPWNKVEKTRHILVHDYFDVNWDIVWRIMEQHLPSLKHEVQKVMKFEGFKSA